MNLNLTIEGHGTVTGDFAALQEMAAAHWPSELARLQEMSLITGGEVVYDLTMFGEDWSPAYMHGQDEPGGMGELCHRRTPSRQGSPNHLAVSKGMPRQRGSGH